MQKVLEQLNSSRQQDQYVSCLLYTSFPIIILNSIPLIHTLRADSQHPLLNNVYFFYSYIFL